MLCDKVKYAHIWARVSALASTRHIVHLQPVDVSCASHQEHNDNGMLGIFGLQVDF